MNTVRANRRSARALKTLTLLAFVWGAVWTSLADTTPAPAPAPAAAEQPAAASQAAAPPASASAEEDVAARMFIQKCAGCHTVGRGKLTGPDLNNAATWPVPDLSRAIKLMEQKVGPIPDADVALLADLLKAPTVKDRLKAEEGRAAQAAAATLEPPSALVGAALFAGQKSLGNGGAACSSCHSINGSGGTLGPDLTAVHAKLGETPLASATEKASFKVMSAAYKDHPVTRQEALHITSYLATTASATSTRTDPPVGAYGAGSALLGLGALGIAYRRRTSGVRKDLLRRGR